MTRRTTIAFLGTTALALILAGRAVAADVEFSTNTTGSFDLDTQTGSTVEVKAGVTVDAGSSHVFKAATTVWTITNFGSILETTGNIGNINTIQLLTGGSVVNKTGATIQGDNSAIIIGTNNVPGTAGSVVNDGTIKGGIGDGVLLKTGGTVTNNAGALIENNGIGNAVSISGGTVKTVINHGTIRNLGSGNATGVLIQGGAGTITNSATGQIIGGFNGTYTSGTAPLTLNNAGLIESTRGPAVEAAGGGTLTNTGTIKSALTSSTNGAVRHQSTGTVINEGTIESGTHGVYVTGSGNVINRGTITAATGRDAIRFTGSAARSVTLGTGSVLNGNATGGSGTDTLVLQGTGTEDMSKFSAFELFRMEGTLWTVTGTGGVATSGEIAAGTLQIATGANLSAPTFTVGAAGTLTGTGTLTGAVTNQGSVRVAPANNLLISGTYAHAAGAFLDVALTPAESGNLFVTGAAALSGGTVRVLASGTTWAQSQTYTILTAASVTGQFAGVTTNLAFLTPTLTYIGTNVFLRLERNSIDFEAIAKTDNQAAAGRAVDSLGAGDPIWDAVIGLDADGARAAFDAVSGEVHASILTLALDESRHLREAALDRMRSRLGGTGPQVMTVTVPPRSVLEGLGPSLSIWGRGYGAQRSAEGPRGVAGAEGGSGGFVAGLDATFEERWMAGFAAGFSHGRYALDGRASRATLASWHAALYGAGELGAGLAVRAGAGATLHDLGTERRIGFAGINQTLEGEGRAATGQVFGEIGQRFRFGAAEFEAFAGAAHVALRADGLKETGGSAALAVRDGAEDATTTTLGLRAGLDIPTGWTPMLRLTGSAGWRHAFTEARPTRRLAFASGSDAFAVEGLPLDRDALALGLGLDAELAPGAVAKITYAGEIGRRAASHALRFGLTIRM